MAPLTRRNETRELTHPIRAAVNVVPGVRVWRNNAGWDQRINVLYGLGLGAPDLVGMCDGRFFSLEVKWPGEKPNPDQLRWHDTARRLGGFVAVVHSVDEAMAAIVRCRAGAAQ